jgi:hypothetical protein
MKSQTKIWLGVGLVVTGSAAALPPGPASTAIAAPGSFALSSDSIRGASPRDAQWILVQHAMPAGGEAGEAGVPADLPPDFQFALTLALIRGHLLVGDELVRAGKWDAALPHFLHPTEELYSGIKDKVADYHTPAFDTELLKLADVVKEKNSTAYTNAFQSVTRALDTGEAGVKAKEADWSSFVVATVIMALKTAIGEYENAIVKGQIAKPVEYQDSRGFVWQAERMIESVSQDLARKDPAALKSVRAGLAQLKKAWPTATPPRTPVKSAAAVADEVGNIQRAAAKLM